MVVFVLGVAIRNEGTGGEDKRIMGSVLAFNGAMARIERGRWACLERWNAKVNFVAAVGSDVDRGSGTTGAEWIARVADG